MMKAWLRLGGMAALAAAAIGLGRPADAGVVTVYSIDPAPGDLVTYNDAQSSGGGVALDASGEWAYTGFRPGGSIGINNTYADNTGGAGSLYINAAGPLGRAYLYHYFDAADQQVFTSLSALTYDWKIAEFQSGVARAGVPIRLLVEVGDGKVGEVVWEPVENRVAADAGDHDWRTSNVLTTSGNKDSLWTNSADLMDYLDNAAIDGGPTKLTSSRYWGSLTQWNAALADAKLIGFAVGVSSLKPTGDFTVAVDNITIGFNNVDTTYNFEVVPEPGSIVMGLIAGGLGLAGAAWRRRRVG